MAKKRFYAIKKGKGNTKNKIVETWSECKDLVLGYPAEYKGFATKEEAEIYLGIKNISNRGSVLKMRISHVKSIFPADTNGLQTF